MPSERIQRRIDHLLDEAEAAADAQDWTLVRRKTAEVLGLDPDNADAPAMSRAAEKVLSSGNSLERAEQDTISVEPAPVERVLPESFVNGRYEVRAFLGEGGRKEVYLAQDTRLEREVAVAVIKTDGLDELGRGRILREAQTMARLGGHANIVTVFDFGEDDGRPYIVSEYMAGGSLDDLIDQVPQRQLPIRDVLTYGVAAAQALAHAHDVIHRDLKPANLMVSADGTAQLGDFGLAFAADEARMTREGTLLGTVAYMPPEQATGRDATALSDLYALGAVLYELVTGRPPFLGDDMVAVVSQHVNAAPVAPSWHNAVCPRTLEELILHLLAKAPEDRPASAADVVRALQRIEPDAAPAPDTDVANPLDRLARGVFVGRESEIRQVRAAVDDMIGGRGGTVLLVGEPGIGKTQTALELETYARLRGAQSLWGRSHEADGAPPYWPWIQALRTYVASVEPADLRRQLGTGASDVAGIVSEIRQALPDLAASGSLSTDDAAQFRLFDSTASFLRNAAADQPLVVFLDDLHWADRPTLRLLTHVALEIERSPVLLVATYRDVEVGRQHPLEEVLAQLSRAPRVRTLDLKGLSSGEIASLLQESSGVAADAQTVDAIARETNGNPFFVTEIVSLLAQEGKLGTRDIPIPPSVRSVVGRRLSVLSDECNVLLRTAAVIGREFTSALLCRLRDIEPVQALELLDEAEAARLIEPTKRPGEYRFVHALIRETLEAELPTARRVRAHGEIAEALEAQYGTRNDQNAAEHAAELALHFSEAVALSSDFVDRALRYQLQAAHYAQSRAAWDEAVQHYRRFLDTTELRPAESQDPIPVLSALCEAERRAGFPQESMLTSQRIAEIARTRNDPCLLADAAVAFEDAYLVSGQVRLSENDPSILLNEEALATLPSDAEARRCRVMAALSRATYFAGDAVRAEELATAALAIARSLDDDALKAYALASQRQVLLDVSRLPQLLAVSEELLEMARRIGDIDRQTDAHDGLIMAATLLGTKDDFDQRLAAYVEHAERIREPSTLAQARVQTAYSAGFSGDWETADVYLAEARALGERSQNRNIVVQAAFTEFVIAAAMGDPDRLTKAMQLQDSHAEEFGDAFTHVRLFPALERAKRGDLESCRLLLDGLSLTDLVTQPTSNIWLLSIQLWVQAAVLLHDHAKLEQLVDIVTPYSAIVLPWNDLGSIRALRGYAATELGHHDDAIRLLTEGWREVQSLGYPPLSAVTLLMLAQAHAARGGPDDAALTVAFAAQALEIAEPLHMRRVSDSALDLRLRLQGANQVTSGESVELVAAAVAQERPDLSPASAPDGTVTLLFSDIENSTARTTELGDTIWMQLLRQHNQIIRDQLAANGGYEVKSMGDGFMLAFGSAVDGLRCAIGIQRGIAARNAQADEMIRVRIGLHTGEAIRETDDFFGTHVNLAARVGGAAQGEEILVSALLKALTDSSGEFVFDDGREVELKGIRGTQRVHAVAWR